MAKLVYDGKDAIFGRLASVVAKDLLKGYFVEVINCEEIIISGDKRLFVKKILAKRKMGSGSSMKGPKYIRVADRLIKRMIRGMLPWDKPKGREAFKRLRCYEGNGPLNEKELRDAKRIEYNKPLKYSTIKEILSILK